MVEVVVYLAQDYKLNKSIYLSKELTKAEITERVNALFKIWYYYDIW